MGMDARLTVVGIKPPGDKWAKYKQAWEACEAAGVDVPDDVMDFFGEVGPQAEGVAVKIGGIDVERLPGALRQPHDCIIRIIDDLDVGSSETGIVIDITRLPADVRWLKITVDRNW